MVNDLKQLRYWLWAICGILLLAKSANSQVVTVDGSSTVYPIAKAAVASFDKLMQGSVQVSLAGSRTGAGFKKFCRGEIDINNASRPILKAEMELCKRNGIRFVELPIAYDALTVVVTPRNHWVKSITAAELKSIWEPRAQGKINSWQLIRAGWPKRPLEIFAPNSNAGTFDYFTDAVVGETGSSRSDYSANDDVDGLIDQVANNRYAMSQCADS